jgi:hypothetical protein
MSNELRDILADGLPVSKSRLRDFLSRNGGGAILAEGYGVTAQIRPLPVQPPRVQSANHAGIMAALQAAVANGGGTVVLPAGNIYVNERIDIGTRLLGDPFTRDDPRKRVQVNIVGAGRRATKLIQNHAKRSLIRVLSSEGIKMQPSFELRLQALTLLGRGPHTRGALVELYSWTHHVLDDVWLEGTAGPAIHISQSERIVLRDVAVYHCRQALMAHDAVNETYLFNFLPLACGMTADPVDDDPEMTIWGPNIDRRGKFLMSGPIVQATRGTVHIEGSQNLRWIGGSCKPLPLLAALKIRGCENAQIDNVYFEGYPVRDPAPNPSVIFGGAMEKTELSAPCGALDTVLRVADSSWFPRCYADMEELGRHEARLSRHFAIYDRNDPTEYEVLLVRGFVGNDMHVYRRGQPGKQMRLEDRPARAWPAGSVVIELAFWPGDMMLHGNHLEGFAPFIHHPEAELREDWVKGETNGQIIVGFTFDEFCSFANFDGGDFPGSCHLQLSGHNRVRYSRNVREATDLVQVHHRAAVHVSQESRLGGLRVEQASPALESNWLTLSHGLSDLNPLILREPGGALNVRVDRDFDPDEGLQGEVENWHPLFVAPHGAVTECRLYSVRPDYDREQGRDFIAAFVIDSSASWPPEIAMRYLRGKPELTPHLRLRHFGDRRAVSVELGLTRTAAPHRRKLQLRCDVMALCGSVEEAAPEPPVHAEWIFPVSAARALDIAQVPAAPVQGGGEAGELFVEDGALMYRGPTGTVTVIAPR